VLLTARFPIRCVAVRLPSARCSAVGAGPARPGSPVACSTSRKRKRKTAVVSSAGTGQARSGACLAAGRTFPREPRAPSWPRARRGAPRSNSRTRRSARPGSEPAITAPLGDLDLRGIPAVAGMEVRRRMVAKVHLDHDPVKGADPGHVRSCRPGGTERAGTVPGPAAGATLQMEGRCHQASRCDHRISSAAGASRTRTRALAHGRKRPHGVPHAARSGALVDHDEVRGVARKGVFAGGRA
jgi:hypothetical protein